MTMRAFLAALARALAPAIAIAQAYPNKRLAGRFRTRRRE
jgi:hypothetical protein